MIFVIHQTTNIMSENRKIKILADSAYAGSPEDAFQNGAVSFKRGDDLSIEVAFLQNKKTIEIKK